MKKKPRTEAEILSDVLGKMIEKKTIPPVPLLTEVSYDFKTVDGTLRVVCRESDSLPGYWRIYTIIGGVERFYVGVGALPTSEFCNKVAIEVHNLYRAKGVRPSSDNLKS